MPTGAIIGSAVVGAGSSIVAGNKAANAQKQAAQQSSDVQRYMFDQSRADQAPYREVGTAALGKLAEMYGVGTGGGVDWGGYFKSLDDPAQRDYLMNWSGAPGSLGKMTPEEYGKFYYTNDLRGKQANDPNYTGADLSQFKGGVANYGGFTASPGYQFRLDEGQKAIERSAAARGGLNSGATMKALNNYAQNTASAEYENYANALRSMAGIGQTSAAQTGALGVQTGQAIGNNIMNAGNARASSYANTGAAINNFAGNMLYGQMTGAFNGGGGGGATINGMNGSQFAASLPGTMSGWQPSNLSFA